MPPESKKTSLSRIQDRIHRLLSQADSAKQRKKLELTSIKELKKELKAVLEAQGILQEIAQKVQQDAHHRICQVVSECLAAVFEDPYEFKLDFVKKRGKTEAVPVFVRDGYELDPMDSTSGGVKDITCLALRLISIVLSRPQKKRVVFADEPFKNMNPHYLPLIPEMLKTLSKELEFQIVLTTNIPDVVTGKVVKVKK